MVTYGENSLHPKQTVLYFSIPAQFVSQLFNPIVDSKKCLLNKDREWVTERVARHKERKTQTQKERKKSETESTLREILS